MEEGQEALILVRNIPSEYHSHNLRKFFSQFVETSRFACFHFRHRPEVKQDSTSDAPTSSSARPSTRCCLVKVKSEDAENVFQRYADQHWTDDNDEELNSKCVLTRVKVANDHDGAVPPDGEGERKLARSDLATMPELRPPPLMPQGNVGTPTEFFLRAIKECRMPPKLISKLKLEFPRSRRRRAMGAVAFDYDTLKTGRERFLERQKLDELARSGPKMESLGSDPEGAQRDDDTCEEWERHEALHNDVAARRACEGDISQQPGTKERLFEEEMEVTWDKGSSGLVFYTDAQFWKAREGDFDEQTTDDWDVDMEVHYDPEGGDKDARDGLEARRSHFYRDGKVEPESAFKKSGKGAAANRRKRRYSGGSPGSGKIGAFEKHTKGFGRRLMEKQGWKDGEGLGSTYKGMAEALDNEGQTDRGGLGYHGEVIPRFSKQPEASTSKLVPFRSSGESEGSSFRISSREEQISEFKKPKEFNRRKRETIRDVIISTKYDRPDETDPGESVERTNPQNYLKYRAKPY